MFPETAVAFTERLLALPQPFRMGDIFALAKESIGLPVAELDALLDHDQHEVRVGALSIMDKQARRKRTPPEQRQASTAVGGLLREAGKRDPERLRVFLDAYAADLSAIALRFAIEKLDAPTRAHYRALRTAR